MLGLLGRFRRYPAEPFDRNVRRLGRYNATFPGQGMIAKLFRTIRMNFLRRKKCFHDHGLTELKAWGSRDFVFGTALDGVPCPRGMRVLSHQPLPSTSRTL